MIRGRVDGRLVNSMHGRIAQLLLREEDLQHRPGSAPPHNNLGAGEGLDSPIASTSGLEQAFPQGYTEFYYRRVPPTNTAAPRGGDT